MSNQQQVISLIKSLSGQANILTIPRVYINLLDRDITAALLLNQIVYWSDRSRRNDGWFYKSYQEWDDETGLTQYQVARGAKKLKAMGIIDTKLKKANNAPTIHYRLNFDLLTELIIKLLDNEETSLSENHKTDYEVSAQSMDYKETKQSLTETTKTTTETTEILSCWRLLFPNKPQPREGSKVVRERMPARLRNAHFRENWRAALERAAASATCQAESWFNFEFFVRNDENYQKMLDGWMSWKDEQRAKTKPAAAAPTPNGNGTITENDDGSFYV